MDRKRYAVLDGIRGFALLHMIVYHGVWDLVYLFGFDWPWYESGAAYVWQQGICWFFLFLSGFCQPLSRQKLKRGIAVFCCGALISAVTLIAMPEQKVLFGVLTLIGSCMILFSCLEHILKGIKPGIGFGISLAFFFLTRNVNQGWLGFERWKFWKLPDGWYCSLASAYLGFPGSHFYSTDYFSLFPWVFLFAAGYFFHRICSLKGWLKYLEKSRIKAAEWLGRHSLAIYMLHQPALYIILTAFCRQL